MELENVSTTIKPRNSWQSIDLGIQMVRSWWRPLYGSWFLFTFPVYLLLHILMPLDPMLPILVFWWLKPFFESMLLYYFSHALFGEFLTIKQVIRDFPGQGRTQILHYLTFRRFSPYRSFTMPVSQLEKLAGDRRKQRVLLLSDKTDSNVFGMFVFCLHFECFLNLAFYGILLIFIPFELTEDYASSFFPNNNSSLWHTPVAGLLTYLAISLVAPFHMGAGFSLYINRRAALEGWDIELVFRQIANRFHKNHGSRLSRSGKFSKVLSTLVLIGFSCAVCLQNVALAQEPGLENKHETGMRVTHDGASSKEKITSIIAGEEFHNKKTITRYRFMDEWKLEKKMDDKSWLAFLKSLKGILIWIAASIEIILWITFLLLMLTIIYKYRHWFSQMLSLSEKEKKEHTVPETLFGLDIKKESLPENIPGTVLELWRNGEKRKALNLLYRSALSYLVNNYDFVFLDAYTEQECIDLVSVRMLDGISDYFKTLTIQWQLLAYGHRYPETRIIESLCQEWRDFFEKDDLTDLAAQEGSKSGL